jgi:hypothetical protein
LDPLIGSPACDRTGRMIGTLRFPPRFRILEVGWDYVLDIRLDEDNVQAVEVYCLIIGR